MTSRTFTEDDVARILAVALERFVQDSVNAPRVYPLEQVAVIANMSLRSLQDDCRDGKVEHVHRRDFRGMTAEQIHALIEKYTEGGDSTVTVVPSRHSSAVQGSLKNAKRAGVRRAS